MWTAWVRAGGAMAVLSFLMWLTVQILGQMVTTATAGQYSSAPEVTRVAGYFNALTVDNLTLIAGLSVAVYLLGRAAVERQLG